MKAEEQFRVRILPAGRDDRTAEISDRAGNVLKYVFCPHRLGNDINDLEDRILGDLKRLDAGEFYAKYAITPVPGGSGDDDLQMGRNGLSPSDMPGSPGSHIPNTGNNTGKDRP